MCNLNALVDRAGQKGRPNNITYIHVYDQKEPGYLYIYFFLNKNAGDPYSYVWQGKGLVSKPF